MPSGASGTVWYHQVATIATGRPLLAAYLPELLYWVTVILPKVCTRTGNYYETSRIPEGIRECFCQLRESSAHAVPPAGTHCLHPRRWIWPSRITEYSIILLIIQNPHPWQAESAGMDNTCTLLRDSEGIPDSVWNPPGTKPVLPERGNNHDRRWINWPEWAINSPVVGNSHPW